MIYSLYVTLGVSRRFGSSQLQLKRLSTQYWETLDFHQGITLDGMVNLKTMNLVSHGRELFSSLLTWTSKLI